MKPDHACAKPVAHALTDVDERVQLVQLLILVRRCLILLEQQLDDSMVADDQLVHQLDRLGGGSLLSAAVLRNGRAAVHQADGERGMHAARQHTCTHTRVRCSKMRRPVVARM